MTVYESDPDVVRWGLNQLCARPAGNPGRHSAVTQFDADLSHDGYVQEGYCEPISAYVENDATIARAFQEELSALAAREARGYSDLEEKQLQASISAQDWVRPQKIDETSAVNKHGDVLEQAADESGSSAPLGSPEKSHQGPPQPPEEIDETALGGEVEKRLDQMVPIPHVPRINGDIPSENDAESDHQRLLDRLEVYELVELKVKGDGNCQFRSLSDQIYRTSEYHGYVRQVVVDQLKSHPEMYEGYVPMSYGEYLKRMSKSGEWGDHVTLQAAADTYGIRIFVLTSFRDTCYIEILPEVQKSNRVIFLSFWAEVHYNSIYPEGGINILLYAHNRSFLSARVVCLRWMSVLNNFWIDVGHSPRCCKCVKYCHIGYSMFLAADSSLYSNAIGPSCNFIQFMNIIFLVIESGIVGST